MDPVISSCCIRRRVFVGVSMNEAPLKQTGLKKDWQLDARAFNGLLVYLDAGSNSEGQNYLQIRDRLVRFFDRKNCLTPDELADETLNRVARRLEEEGSIQSDSPAKFCYTIARYVFLESLRSNRSKEISIDDDVRPLVDNGGIETDEAEQKE